MLRSIPAFMPKAIFLVIVFVAFSAAELPATAIDEAEPDGSVCSDLRKKAEGGGVLSMEEIDMLQKCGTAETGCGIFNIPLSCMENALKPFEQPERPELPEEY